MMIIAVAALVLGSGPIAAETDTKAALSAVKKLVGFIRFEKNDLALKQVGLVPISRFLMGSYYDRATPEQQTRFQTLLGEYVELRAFPLALKYFKDIDLSYEEPVIKGRQVLIRSSLLYAGSEQVMFTWVLEQHDGQYTIVDILDNGGKSSILTNRDKQIQPVLKKNGVAGLLTQMEKVVAKAREQ